MQSGRMEGRNAMAFFDKIRSGLARTRHSVMGQVNSVLHGFSKIDDSVYDDLEEVLVAADVGVPTAEYLIGRLRERVRAEKVSDPDGVRGALQHVMAEELQGDTALHLTTKPSVILVVGVNGVGKTTTIGKLAASLTAGGQKVLLAAADTFRAAAAEQLQIWADRAGTQMVRQQEGSDPAAVLFDALAAAKARGCDVVIGDTAGRLHNRKNLMDELGKISHVVDRELPGCARENLLVVDATTGQNAIAQARAFGEAAGLTGVVLTKLDGTARGGVIFAIRHELGLPVKFIGVGEGIDDLQPFDAEEFVAALFAEE